MANIKGTEHYKEQRDDNMSVLGAAAILGGASLLGSVYTQEKQSDEASFSRKWQKQMSNTAHFRQMADMRRAGLNPILSAGGSGASTPGGAMASLSPMQNPLNQGIEAAQGLASAKLTGENAKLASLEAKHKTAFYKMLEGQPGGSQVAAFNAMFPGNKIGQTVAAFHMGVGKGDTKGYSVNTGKLTSETWKAIKKQLLMGLDVRFKGKASKSPKVKEDVNEDFIPKNFIVPYDSAPNRK